jgi:hypothetical protein
MTERAHKDKGDSIWLVVYDFSKSRPTLGGMNRCWAYSFRLHEVTRRRDAYGWSSGSIFGM